MAIGLLSTPSLTFSISSKNKHIKEKYLKVAKHNARNTLLRSHLKFNGLNKLNLFRRISKLNNRLCLFVFCVEYSNSLDTFVIQDEENSAISIDDFFNTLSNNQIPTYCLFFLSSNPKKLLSELKKHHKKPFFCICCLGYDLMLPVISIACEINNWWGCKSLIHKDIYLKHIYWCIQNVLGKIKSFNGSNYFYLFGVQPNKILWRGGQIYTKEIDYDKILTESRVEQISDTLKRILDESYNKRSIDTAPQKNRSISQAFLWLCEIGDEYEKNWFFLTRFFEDTFTNRFRKIVPKDFSVRPKKNIDEEKIQIFIQNFCSVTGGEYQFGTSINEEESEPPAAFHIRNINQFKIFVHPITFSDWLIFSYPLPHWEKYNNCLQKPVVNVNAIEAMLFAQIIQNSLKKIDRYKNCRVSLPTEFEWEAAARGKMAFEYPWGNEFNLDHCNCNLAFGYGTSDVNLFSPAGDSPSGCQDMAGNVREWTSSYAGIKGLDWAIYNTDPIIKNLDSIAENDRLIIRGGSYSYDSICVKTWVRNTNIAVRKDTHTGFRLVLLGS